MRADAAISAIQERVNKVLPRIVGPDPLHTVRVLVRRGDKEGTALVQLSYPDRENERGKQLIVPGDLALLTKWSDLAFADFVAKAVKRLFHPD